MRFFSILLAGVFLTVAGCGGDDATPMPSGGAAGGAAKAPDAGRDPGAMETDPIKDDDGNEVTSGPEDPPPGSKLTPEPPAGAEKKVAPKKDAPKKDAPKKDAPKKDAPKKDDKK